MSAGCVPLFSSGSSSKLAEFTSLMRLMTELLISLLAVGQGPLLAPKATLRFLPRDPLHKLSKMAVGFFKASKIIPCFDSLPSGKAWALLWKAHLMRSGPPRKIFLSSSSESTDVGPYICLQNPFILAV